MECPGAGVSALGLVGVAQCWVSALLGQSCQWAPSALLRGTTWLNLSAILQGQRLFLTPEPATSHISTSFFKLWEGAGIFKEAIQAKKEGKNLVRIDKTV